MAPALSGVKFAIMHTIERLTAIQLHFVTSPFKIFFMTFKGTLQIFIYLKRLWLPGNTKVHKDGCLFFKKRRFINVAKQTRKYICQVIS